jgi:hypothetical protein
VFFVGRIGGDAAHLLLLQRPDVLILQSFVQVQNN